MKAITPSQLKTAKITCGSYPCVRGMLAFAAARHVRTVRNVRQVLPGSVVQCPAHLCLPSILWQLTLVLLLQADIHAQAQEVIAKLKLQLPYTAAEIGWMFTQRGCSVFHARIPVFVLAWNGLPHCSKRLDHCDRPGRASDRSAVAAVRLTSRLWL